MVDQNPQVNQNVNNQNENDELFWWSDDIFENSDLLQPIDSEVATAHEVIKSQNDLNNFNWEVKSNQSPDEESLWNILDEQPEVSTVAQQPENITSDDLFEENQPVQNESNESNESFDNLYDEAPQENQTQNNDVSVNDDIFEEGPVAEEKIDEIPEIEDIADEDEPQEDKAQPEIENEVKQPEMVSQPEVVDAPEIVENHDSENIQEVPENKQVNNDEMNDEIDDLDDIEDLDDFDDIDEIDEIQDWEESTEEWKINSENTEVKEAIVPEKDEEDIEDDEGAEKWFIQNNGKVEEDDDVDIVEETDEEDQESSDDDIENNVIQDYEKYDPNKFKTDVQKKFGELQRKTEKIHELVWKDMDVWFDLLWWNDDRQKIIYKIVSWSDYVEIEKEELNKADESTITNILSFELSEDLEQNMSVQLFVNDIELYDEIKDLQNDPNKKMQVLEKMNKFIFLLDEEYKKIQKYKKEKEERNAVKWVFRNF